MGYRDDVGDAPNRETVEKMELQELISLLNDEQISKVIEFIKRFILG